MYSKEELKNLKQDFWESFSTFCSLQPYLKGRKKMWMLYDTKVKGAELKFEVEASGVAVLLEINHSSITRREEILEILRWNSKGMAKGFAERLQWEDCFTKPTGETVSRLYVEGARLNFHNRSNWGEIFNSMAQDMYRLENNFKRLKDQLAD